MLSRFFLRKMMFFSRCKRLKARDPVFHVALPLEKRTDMHFG